MCAWLEFIEICTDVCGHFSSELYFMTCVRSRLLPRDVLCGKVVRVLPRCLHKFLHCDLLDGFHLINIATIPDIDLSVIKTFGSPSLYA